MDINYDTIKLLNVEQDEILSCETYTEGDNFFFNITLKVKETPCPVCGTLSKKIKSYSKRKIIHSILNGRKTIINYRQRRYECTACHKTYVENNPFTIQNERISLFTKVNILEQLKDPDITFTKVAKLNNITVSSVANIFDEAVAIPRGTLTKVISIDEFHDINNSLCKYSCVLMDFNTMKILDVIKSRQMSYLANYFTSNYTKEELNTVQMITSDMHLPYKELAKRYFHNACVSVDQFHVIKDINNRLDKVRIRIMNSYDDKSTEYYLLKKFNWLLTKNSSDIKDNEAKYNRKLHCYVNYKQILTKILDINMDLYTAYYWKESYSFFNETYTKEKASKGLHALIDELKAFDIKEFKSLPKVLEEWFDEIVNSFTIIDGCRVNNCRLESRNSIIKTIKYVSRGMPNFQRLRNRIMYCVNKELKFIDDPKYKTITRISKKRGHYKKKSK